MNETPLRALIIEDSEDDTKLLLRELKHGGYLPVHARVDTAPALAQQLASHTWDIVYADYTMPRFTGMDALAQVRAYSQDLPFIFVSGTIGEDTAVEAMRMGAQDYIMKNHLKRLLPATQRELYDARIRQERRKSEQARQRLINILEATVDLVAIADVDGHLQYMNHAGRTLLGMDTERDLPPINLKDCYADEAINHFLSDALPTAQLDNVWTGETALKGQAGEIPVSLVLLAHKNTQGEVEFFSSVARDISERKKFEAMLQYHATHDALTGLANRVLLVDRLDAELKRAARQQHKVAVFFLDLDNFKRINDSLGHGKGDLLLKHVAQQLQECLRPSDTIARYGGDEFTLVVGDISDIENVLTVLHKLQSIFEKPFSLEGNNLYVTFSAGIALYPSDGNNAAELVKNADAAMYLAKAKGRNKFQFYTPSINERSQQLLELESALRLALLREEFILHYQPQVNLTQGHVAGVEALIRWRNPHQGLMQPADFLPMLEDTGLILPVGEWILRRACADWRNHCNAGHAPVRIAVNVSPTQFMEPDWVDTVRQVLKDECVDAQWLELEITENLLMQDTHSAGEILQDLHSLGIRFAIDDFGTGYSSMAYLKRFPLSTLKIDKEFVLQMAQSQSDQAIVEASILLGHRLGLELVAEGVEDRASFEWLKKTGCDFAQGFWFSRPFPFDQTDALLAQKHVFT